MAVERNFSEQELIRREKLKEMKLMGINPYPADEVKVDFCSLDAKQYYTQHKEQCEVEKTIFSMTGRIMSMRDMGKASFAVIQDAQARMQLYVKRDELVASMGEDFYDKVWKKLIDIGDIIQALGYLFTTKTGEISLHVSSLKILAKSLHPLPVVKEVEGQVFDAVSDVEFKYRQRYAHLIIEPEVKKIFQQRNRMIQEIRNFYNSMDMLEVETPVLQSIPGGANAKPFTTHHNALNMPLYLRIANELYLKRLIVGGFDGVYEFSRNFRNEGIDRTHNPEFTVMEMYATYKDYQWMMRTTETLLEQICMALHGKSELQVGTETISFKAPFRRIKLLDAIKEYGDIDLNNKSEEEIRHIAMHLKVHEANKKGKGKLIDEIFGVVVEPHLIQATFITDYPIETSTLTKKHRDNPLLVERFELYINGKEIANAYSELNDPIDQLQRFQDQAQLQAKGDEEAMHIDYDFIRALEYGMPPTAGIGIGIDRLCMLMTNSASIQDVLFFPQMRLEKEIR